MPWIGPGTQSGNNVNIPYGCEGGRNIHPMSYMRPGATPPSQKKILPRGIVGQALLNLFLKANFLSQPYIPLFLPCIYPAPHQPAVAAKKNLRNKGLFEAFLVAD